ncbi:acyl carrier protein [Verrucomicrobium sp. GAS474]|uniref:acyl carrier protein n=1 Tax=Verrucomicrobium sp. GAS474 TaxID=1882831 RepID=UPI00087C2632|nr:acyl carrier protein [Verrucomicrobium sp. GAS474]SDU05062.1 acyl carrier protein [Verrucomicrobium sp. GAS474]
MQPVSLEQIRTMLVENCMLKVDPSTIEEDTPLLGPDGLGLDSLDALQLTVAIEAAFQTPIKDPALAKQILQTPGTIRHWVERQQALSS